MKITFVLPCVGLAGGIRVTAIYAEKLKQRGHQVCVVSLPSAPIQLKEQIKSLLRGQGWLRPTLGSHFDGRDIEHRILEKHRPVEASDVPDADVVVATWWETAEWIARFPASKGAKVYFIQHHEAIFPGQPQERVKATWFLPMYKIVISNWLVDVARTFYGDDGVSLVPNSVDTKQFFAPPRNKQPVPTVGLMYVDLLWKGSDICLKAFEIAARKIPNLRLVAFGSKTPSPNLPLPAGATFIHCPPQDQIKNVYAQCDAWLFGSRSEGFGMPLLESMACRTPVIGTPAGAAPELLKEGAGILVNPEDPEDMAQAIERVCQLSDQEWQAMSQAAYNRAVSYTWDDATDLFEAALYQAMEMAQSNAQTSQSKGLAVESTLDEVESQVS
ncbi:MAG: glycosyltransferase family 4 protein [Cyanobacteria bacterium RM1_2_2]|nr:glycosyltransferase family 4 protein [Cyanobacteria bacterium RM1_2_2]